MVVCMYVYVWTKIFLLESPILQKIKIFELFFNLKVFLNKLISILKAQRTESCNFFRKRKTFLLHSCLNCRIFIFKFSKFCSHFSFLVLLPGLKYLFFGKEDKL